MGASMARIVVTPWAGRAPVTAPARWWFTLYQTSVRET